jgi:ribosome-associated toxin RatA of RatAB toxin-antitoxin module
MLLIRHTSRFAALAAAAAIIGALRPAWSAQDVAVEAKRHGNALAITAHATLRAPLALIWHTLTDYDHLAQFIPGMNSSRVIERRGNTAIVEQTGEASFWFFHYPIAVTVQSDEHYPAAIGVRVLTGNLRQLAGGYRIEAVVGRSEEFVVQWRGIIEPDIFLPLFITAPGLRQIVTDQFLGMIDEIERRGTLRRNQREN